VSAPILSNGFERLAGRLTDPQDRETYGHLVTYVQSLPPGDEFRRLVELLGLLTLLGRRLPEAAAELLAEMRSLAKASADYHAQVDQRLAGLPGEISAGVDVAAIGREMSESFRQQLTAAGLQESAGQLRAAAKEIDGLMGQMSAALKPATREYQTVSSTISAELGKLIAASRDLERHNAQLVAQQRSSEVWWQATAALVLFLLGGVCGIMAERRQITSGLLNAGTQLERSQPPILPPAAPPLGSAKKR
jgi:hypothetical protein